MAAPGNVEDIYPLTPMQQGMIFHALYAPDSGVYVQQVSARLRGRMDPELFRRTWQALVDRHPVLRTAFDWERRAEPFQVVYRQATLPWTEHDWSGEVPTTQAERLEALIAKDRARGFTLSRPPLARVSLVRLDTERWQLLWTHHHLILDGWSVPLLLQDLFALHAALSENRPPTLEPRRPFRDHVAWTRRESREAAQGFWTAELSGLENPPPLPSKPRAGSTRSFAGPLAHESVRLTRTTTGALQAFARGHDLTLGTIVQGAWAIVLGRFTNGREVLYGATVAGRSPSLTGADRMIGLFINTILVRVGLPPAASVVTWLQELQARLSRQRAYEHTPLVDVLGWSGPGGERPAFESVFVFENYPVDATVGTGAPGLEIEQADAHEQTDFPVTFVVVPGDELLLKIDYDGGRFERSLAAGMLGGLTEVLDAIVRLGDVRLADLNVLREADRRRIELPNETRRAWTGPAFVHEIIDQQAILLPDAPAITSPGATITFAQLRRRSDAVASALTARGIGPEHRVGVEMARSPDLVAVILGVMKAGAAYVPLELTYPRARRAFAARDAGVTLVIADDVETHAADRAPDVHDARQAHGSDGSAAASYGSVPVLSLGALLRAGSVPPRGTDPDGLAYVLYTSGSTGMPKGVMVTHRGLSNYVRWAVDAYDAGAGNGAPFHSPLGFDLTVTSLFPPLAAGRPVQIVPEADGLEGLVRALTGSPRFSLVKITPAHLEALRVLLPAAEARTAARAFVIGGEALSQEQLHHWRAHAPESKLINEYGPTETVVGCAVHDAAGDAGLLGPVPIGRPIANTRLYVVDRMLNLSPVGVMGELFIGGDGVARGYENAPDATAARFVPDPWSPEPGARLYRSGDLARLREDGCLEFLGRNDEQVKIRGHRIEPGEIEAALESHPAVRQAAVIATTGIAGSTSSADTKLLAFVVMDGEPASNLRAWLGQRLPEHFVPAVLTPVDRLPLTPNGKIDRAALAAMAADAPAPRTAYEAPRGPREELLAIAWADVLGRARIGRHDSFFDLGGHSLVATRLTARLRRVFGREIPLRALFERPTIAAYAAYLEADAVGTQAPPITRRPGTEPPVLSLAQQRLWFLHQLDPDSPAYVVPAALWIDGPVDVPSLRLALERLAERHESLRTRIHSEDGRAVASIGPADVPMEVVDLESLPPAEQPAEVQRRADREALIPFNIETGALVRVTLLRLSPVRHGLVLAMHHLVSDAWSMQVFVRDAAALYQAARQSSASSMPLLRVQYADVARWQRERMDGQAGARLLEFWKKTLDGVPSLELPLDRPAPAEPSLRGAARRLAMDPAATAALLDVARREHATPFMAFLAVFELLLTRYSGQQDFVVGTPVAGRDHPDVEPIIGLFMNTVVLRSDVSPGGTFIEMLARVRSRTLDAFAHQELPFERLVDALRPSRDLGHNPIVRVMFTVEHAEAPVDLAGLRFTPIALPTTTSKFDLTLSVTQGNDGWLVTIEYRTGLFDPETVDQMARHYAALVASAAAHPEHQTSRLPVLEASERAREISEWNQTVFDPAGLETVPSMFERQVALSPTARAVVDDAGELTYAALNRRVARLAARLAVDGVGPEALVGVFLERSIDLIVALLAIHRAGGAYLPLDPAYPQDRLAMMIEDAGAALILAHAGIADRLPAGARVLVMERTPDDGADDGFEEGGRLPPRAILDSLGYVIFTSGSTGRPKGVMISHRALANHMRWMQREYPLSAGDCVLQKTAASFDASVWEFFAPLSAGATLVMARPGVQQDPDALVGILRSRGITILQVVPSLLRLLVETGGFDACTSIRRMFAGGEALTADLARRFSAVSRAELVNLYGPTEVTIDSVTWTCRPDDTAGTHVTVPIGRPVDNTTAYVLDAQMEPVPLGVVGELFLGGASVGRGYLGQPALTAERFVPDPFAPDPGGRLYRTGDLVRRRRSGVLEYVGRSDGQVKLRGFRIELDEIERALDSHPSIQQSVATIRDRAGSQQILAYVVPRPGHSLDRQTLRAHVRSRLPEHMVPATIAGLTAVPTLPNGKVDRLSLPAPEYSPREGEYVGPRTEAEATMAGVWSAVLGIPRVSVRDNFFALGGDSIVSLQVVARARKAGLAVTPAQMFLHQTVEALAEVAGGAVVGTPPVVDPAGGPVALTPVQRWFFELPLENRHHWNQAMLLEVPAGLEPDVVRAALGDVVALHDALRLRFTHTDGAWCQEYAGAADPVLDVIDLSSTGEPAAAFDVHVARLQASMQLGVAPLFRAGLFDYGASRPGRLLLIAHHLVVDGVSWRILLDDLAVAYASRQAGSAPSLAPPAATFEQWSRALSAETGTTAWREETAFWMRQVGADAPFVPFDTDEGVEANVEASADDVEVALSAELTTQLLREVHGAYNTQIMDVLVAALADTLGPWTGSPLVSVELEGHGRDVLDIDLSRTVGWFTTLFPVRLDTRPATSPGALLKAIKEQLRAVPRKGLGYGLLRYLIRDAAIVDASDRGDTPAVSFNYLGQWHREPRTAAPGTEASNVATFRTAPEEPRTMRADGGRRTHVVEVVAGIVDARLRVRWTYSRRLHSRDTIARLADAYRRSLHTLIDHCLDVGHGGYTPSDFTASDLDQKQLDKLLAKLRGG